MLSKKYVKNMMLMLVLMFTFAFSMNVHAEEPVDNNDYSNEVVPGYEKTSRWISELDYKNYHLYLSSEIGRQ